MIIPRRKPLAATPDAIRRASLIAAPIALFGGNAALADTAFTKFSFAATGARANRTMPDRLSDIFNVKDYGAYGDYPKPGYHDDTVAIQAALTAAANNWGGIVVFPPGKYHITSGLR
jgi:polygalacturonase